jgi:hypothetical protein
MHLFWSPMLCLSTIPHTQCDVECYCYCYAIVDCQSHISIIIMARPSSELPHGKARGAGVSVELKCEAVQMVTRYRSLYGTVRYRLPMRSCRLVALSDGGRVIKRIRFDQCLMNAVLPIPFMLSMDDLPSHQDMK